MKARRAEDKKGWRARMIRKISMGLLLGAGLLLPMLEERATARSVSASTAAVFPPPHLVGERCAEFDFTTGALVAACDATVIVPLTTDRSGTKTLTFTARADFPVPSSGGPACRAVATDRFGTSFSASPFIEFPTGSPEFESQTTAAVAVPSRGIFVAHCIVNEGTELAEFDYAL